MIDISDALSIVDDSVQTTNDVVRIKLSKACNYVLSGDIYSEINMPPFRQSAMDGYAVHMHDKNTYSYIGELKAGDASHFDLNPGQAVRIFTGAAVPDSADAVVIQERVVREDEKIIVDSPISPQMNIRPLGEQVKAGELALKKGSLMNPAAIGFLASLGIHEVDVYRQPKLCLLITGNELVEAGSILSHGQIYESNGLMLRSALRKSGFETIEIIRVNDDYRETREALRNALSGNDFLLVSGGISVGDYDFVGKALIELGVEELFYKVKQKPGKPLFFGRTSSAYVFALPGNPASALSCFYIYVLKALHMFKGNHRFTLNRVMAKSKSHFKKHGDRPQFLKAFYNNGQVEILDGQNSSMLHTFGVANALVFISAEQIQTDINDEVEVILLPNT